METTMRREGLALPILVALALTVALGANGAKANAQEAVFLLHRAEVGPGWDSPLTEVGRRRVNALAHLLKDAGIDVIYALHESPHARTAEQIAKALNIKSNIQKFKFHEVEVLIRRLRDRHGNDRVLIVGGSTSRDRSLRAFGLPEAEEESRSDNMLVIVPRAREEALLIKIRL